MLKQELKDVGGRTKVDTPDEIFNKYLQLSTSLPTDALSWPIQLCSSFFAALTPELAERMTTDAFRMPPPSLPSVMNSLALNNPSIHKHLENVRPALSARRISVYNCCIFIKYFFIQDRSTNLHRLFLSMARPSLHSDLGEL